MKCDHLLGRKFDGEVYILASDVMESIAELKANLDKAIAERDGNQECIDALKGHIARIKEDNYKLKSSLEQEQSLRSHWNEDDYAMVNEIERLLNENAELKAENTKLKNKIKIYEDLGSCKKSCLALRHNQRRVESEIYKVTLKDKEMEELKQKLENVQASMYCDVVDANMDNRKLRRALWIARAKRAIEKIAWFKLWNASISTMNPEDGARQEYEKWKKNLGKFLKKAEEYK